MPRRAANPGRKVVLMKYTTVFVRYNDPEGWECIESVPLYGSILNSRRLCYLLSIGGEIIPEHE